MYSVYMYVHRYDMCRVRSKLKLYPEVEKVDAPHFQQNYENKELQIAKFEAKY